MTIYITKAINHAFIQVPGLQYWKSSSLCYCLCHHLSILWEYGPSVSWVFYLCSVRWTYLFISYRVSNPKVYIRYKHSRHILKDKSHSFSTIRFVKSIFALLPQTVFRFVQLVFVENGHLDPSSIKTPSGEP